MWPAPGEDGSGDRGIDDAVDDIGHDRALVGTPPDGAREEREAVGEDAAAVGELEHAREGWGRGRAGVGRDGDAREGGDEDADDEVGR